MNIPAHTQLRTDITVYTQLYTDIAAHTQLNTDIGMTVTTMITIHTWGNIPMIDPITPYNKMPEHTV